MSYNTVDYIMHFYIPMALLSQHLQNVGPERIKIAFIKDQNTIFLKLNQTLGISSNFTKIYQTS